MSPQPAKKMVLASLVERINGQKPPLTDLEKARYRRVAEDMKRSADAATHAQGYTVLGVLACIDGDLTAMHDNHRKALVASGNSAVELHNYACSLGWSGLHEQALEYARRAVEKVPAPVYLNLLIEILFRFKRTDELMQALEAYQKVTGEPHAMASQFAAEGILRAYRLLLEDIAAGLVSEEDALVDKASLLDTEDDMVQFCVQASQPAFALHDQE